MPWSWLSLWQLKGTLTPAPETSASAAETPPAPRTPASGSETPRPVHEFLYVYCVVDGAVSEKFGRMGIGGRGDEVYSSPYKDISAIVSRTDRRVFERNEDDVLAHKHVIQDIFTRLPAVPLPFSTIVQNERELENLLASRYHEFRERLEKLQEIYRPVTTLNPNILEGNVLETTTLESNLLDLFLRKNRTRPRG